MTGILEQEKFGHRNKCARKTACEEVGRDG